MPQYLGFDSKDILAAAVALRDFLKVNTTGPLLDAHLEVMNDETLSVIAAAPDDLSFHDALIPVYTAFSQIPELLEFHARNDTAAQGLTAVATAHGYGLAGFGRFSDFRPLDAEINVYRVKHPIPPPLASPLPSPFENYVLVIEGLKEGAFDQEEYETLEERFDDKMADLMRLNEGGATGTGKMWDAAPHGVCFNGTARFVAAVAKRFPNHRIVGVNDTPYVAPREAEAPRQAAHPNPVPRPKTILKL